MLLFIYLTKTHTAKEPIKLEFEEQYKNNDLYEIEFEYEKFEENNKKYIMQYKNKITNKSNMIIISTVDSFNYNLWL